MSQPKTDVVFTYKMPGGGTSGPIPYAELFETELLIKPARLAVALIERWGLVAGQPSGVDHAGRAKSRLMSPESVVDRACTTADLAFAEFRRRGWTVDIGSIEKVEAGLAKTDGSSYYHPQRGK